MLIFRRIFLSNYWWQESDIWSQASYMYAILLLDSLKQIAVQMKRTINPETGTNIFISEFTKISTKQEMKKCALKCT